MIWLTWRQHRGVVAVCSAITLALIVWMWVVQHDYLGAFHTYAKSCQPGQLFVGASVCNRLLSEQGSAAGQATFIRLLLMAAPVLLGIVLGAPLFAVEFERKTVILVFTQGISRTRWMASRWLGICLCVVGLASVLDIIANWWFGLFPVHGPVIFDEVSRIQPTNFDLTGIVPVAYAIFAFALGSALSMVLRRTGLAILGTVGLFITARVLFEEFVRAHLAPMLFAPISFASIARSNRTGGPLYSTGRGWIVRYGYEGTAKSHRSISHAYLDHVLKLCNAVLPSLNSPSCLTQHGIESGVFYQPAGHYWALHRGEAAAFTVAGGALFALAVWSLRRWRA